MEKYDFVKMIIYLKEQAIGGSYDLKIFRNIQLQFVQKLYYKLYLRCVNKS